MAIERALNNIGVLNGGYIPLISITNATLDATKRQICITCPEELCPLCPISITLRFAKKETELMHDFYNTICKEINSNYFPEHWKYSTSGVEFAKPMVIDIFQAFLRDPIGEKTLMDAYFGARSNEAMMDEFKNCLFALNPGSDDEQVSLVMVKILRLLSSDVVCRIFVLLLERNSMITIKRSVFIELLSELFKASNRFEWADNKAEMMLMCGHQGWDFGSDNEKDWYQGLHMKVAFTESNVRLMVENTLYCRFMICDHFAALGDWESALRIIRRLTPADRHREFTVGDSAERKRAFVSLLVSHRCFIQHGRLIPEAVETILESEADVTDDLVKYLLEEAKIHQSSRLLGYFSSTVLTNLLYQILLTDNGEFNRRNLKCIVEAPGHIMLYLLQQRRADTEMMRMIELCLRFEELANRPGPLQHHKTLSDWLQGVDNDTKGKVVDLLNGLFKDHMVFLLSANEMEYSRGTDEVVIGYNISTDRGYQGTDASFISKDELYPSYPSAPAAEAVHSYSSRRASDKINRRSKERSRMHLMHVIYGLFSVALRMNNHDMIVNLIESYDDEKFFKIFFTAKTDSTTLRRLVVDSFQLSRLNPFNELMLNGTILTTAKHFSERVVSVFKSENFLNESFVQLALVALKLHDYENIDLKIQTIIDDVEGNDIAILKLSILIEKIESVDPDLLYIDNCPRITLEGIRELTLMDFAASETDKKSLASFVDSEVDRLANNMEIFLVSRPPCSWKKLIDIMTTPGMRFCNDSCSDVDEITPKTDSPQPQMEQQSLPVTHNTSVPYATECLHLMDENIVYAELVAESGRTEGGYESTTNVDLLTYDTTAIDGNVEESQEDFAISSSSINDQHDTDATVLYEIRDA